MWSTCLFMLCLLSSSRGFSQIANANVWEEEHDVDMEFTDHEQNLIHMHSGFLEPDEMKEFRRLLRWGGGYGGGGNGGLTDAEHQIIQNMIAYRGKMKRTVTPITENNGKVIGSVSVTTSDDPTTAKTIQDHVLGMQKLIQAGRVARQFDPLYVELFAHAAATSEYDIKVETLTKGIKVTETGSNDCAAALIQAHANTVTKFIQNGRSEVQASHSVPDACK